jgi:hypothetical protein
VVLDSPQRDAAIQYLNAALGATGQPAGSCTVFVLTPQNAAAKIPPSHLPANMADMN